jgi:hypothetical protein
MSLWGGKRWAGLRLIPALVQAKLAIKNGWISKRYLQQMLDVLRGKDLLSYRHFS